MHVLVLDAELRSALAITRSLGSRGLHVTCADETEPTLAGSSRFCARRWVYPSPYTQPVAFIGALQQYVAKEKIDVLLPVSEVTTELVMLHRGEFGPVAIPFRNRTAFERLSNKGSLVRLAAEVGVRAPRTEHVDVPGEAVARAAAIGYPVVVKPCRSRVFAGDRWIGTRVHYAASEADLARLVSENDYLQRFPFLIQEKVPGTGRGIFALYGNGRPLAFFAHRRIREKPPWGGVSVLCESVTPEPSLLDGARRLLDKAQWDGVAMVEYKGTSGGDAHLMEVNARFWGSLQLSIDAGVDFPYLLVQSLNGELPPAIDAYRSGTRSRWLLGDLDHLIIRMKNRHRQDAELPPLSSTVRDFLRFSAPNTRYEVNRSGDMGPFWLELRRYVAGMFGGAH